MSSKNMVFQEEYKRLDALCRDLFASKEGVSEYIRQMESVSYTDRRYYFDWDADYRQLKQLRWMRNQLAHEVGTLEEDFCTDAEIAWLQKFHRRILCVCDPLSVVHRGKERAEQRNNNYRTYGENQPPVSAVKKDDAGQKEPENTALQAGRQGSGWARFIAKIKRLFSR